MLSLRHISRAASARRPLIQSTAITRTFFSSPSFLGSTRRLPLSSPLSSSNNGPLLATPTFTHRTLTTTLQPLAEKAGEVDDELVAKVLSELSLERSMRPEASSTPGDESSSASTPSSVNADVTPPRSVTEFLADGPWTVVDVPGQEQVILERDYGNERIRVSFSIADLNELGENEEEDEDRETPGLYDEPEDMEDAESGDNDTVAGALDAQQGGAQTKGSVKQGSTADGNVAVSSSGPGAGDQELMDDESHEEGEDEEEDGSEPGDGPSFPARLTITITKPSLTPSALKNKLNPANAALQILAFAQDGVIAIENVALYRDATLADPAGAEAMHATQELYTGPPFANLDEELQILFDRYLDERGIDTRLALVVGDYVDWKEQREYVGWLEGVGQFVEA